jgi:Ca2+-transporting ATPase
MRRSLPAGRLDDNLGSGQGLGSEEARERLARYGPNDIVEVPGSPLREIASETAQDPMIWFLVGTGVLYGVLGELAEAITLLVSILPLAGMDVFLHQRTRASTEGLRSRLASRATVLRDGARLDLPVAEVVPGDLALVAAGEPFPADGLIEAGEGLQAEESALTGEAYPVRKRPLAPETAAEPMRSIDAEHWGFAGTRLLTGAARLRVAATGHETLYGEIVQSAIQGSRVRTPLQLAVSHLVSVLLVAAIVMCGILGVVRLLQGHGWLDALLSAITLAVAALPEEFPVVFTMFLGVGVFRLARRRALVRRAVSVENIGRISCICADKTGTITLGELHLTHLLPAADTSEDRLLELAWLASRRDSGDPLDAAIARSVEAGAAAPRPEVIATFPFTEDRRRETAVVRSPAGPRLVATKGSPEVVLSLCAMEPSARTRWLQEVDRLAAEGHKVIACAARTLAEDAWAGGEPDRGFVFAGLLACEDPVRESVADAVAECREAGVRVLMVTGDHPATARAVAREVGLGGESPRIVTGEEIDVLLDRGGRAPLAGVDVVARAIPSQKLALVRALQAEGERVAVTGDGVNDVPAIQAADIGIAMGERGTRSAREVAGIVLLEEDFGTIVRAIDEGRQLFRNLCSSFEYLLLIHIPLVVSAALVPLAGYPLLYLPIHIVWLELVIHPSALLAFQELPPPGRLRRASRHHDARFFTPLDWARIGGVGTLITVLVVTGYVWSLGDGLAVEHARAMALAVLTLTSAATTAVLSGLRTSAARWIATATAASSVLIVQTGPLASRLHLEPLHVDDWAIAWGLALTAALPLAVLRAPGLSVSRPTARPASRTSA